MLGFKIDSWDYLAFGALLLLVSAAVAVVVILLGIPGKIAIARKHPDAEAVNLMGYAGFMTFVPWIQALIWAFKPTEVVDIRYFPKEKQREIEEQIARLKGIPPQEAPKPE